MNWVECAKEVNRQENVQIVNAFVLGVMAANGPLQQVSLDSVNIAAAEVSCDESYMVVDRTATEVQKEIIKIAIEVEADKRISAVS